MMKKLIKNLDNLLISSSLDRYPKYLEKEIIGTGQKSLLDVGCGENSPIKYFSKKLGYSVGIDGHPPAMDVSRQAGIHTDYKLVKNLLEIDKIFGPKSFDVVLASDLIEHLSKEEGKKLIKKMELVAKKKVIIFTPNGFLPQSEYGDNKYQAHLSGWEVEEMQKSGYQVIGLGGFKQLKGERAEIKWHPQKIWGRISLLTEALTVNHPKLAFSLMCIKDLG